MNSFWYFFTTKAKQCENDIIRLRKVLETLHKTREGTKEMKVYIKDLRQRCKQAEIDSEVALKILIEKTTSVEKLKAKLGLGGSLATLMQMQEDNENNSRSTADDRLLLNGKLFFLNIKLNKLLLKTEFLTEELDDYDKEFIKMKEDGQKSKQAKMNEEFERTTHVIEDCKRLLLERRKAIENWKNKIDKGCIERIRTFQNPPVLLGQILDMTVTLIGKKKFPELTSSSAKLDRNANDSNTDRADGSKTPKSI